MSHATVTLPDQNDQRRSAGLIPGQVPASFSVSAAAHLSYSQISAALSCVEDLPAPDEMTLPQLRELVAAALAHLGHTYVVDLDDRLLRLVEHMTGRDRAVSRAARRAYLTFWGSRERAERAASIAWALTWTPPAAIKEDTP